MLAGGVAGAALAVFGLSVLVTGRAPTSTARAFRSVRAVGFYHLFFGISLGLVVIATSLDSAAVTTAITVVAIVLAGVALVRFRPHGRQRPVKR